MRIWRLVRRLTRYSKIHNPTKWPVLSGRFTFLWRALLIVQDIPKRVFLFWADGFDVAPRMVRLCVESWQINNPDFEIILLDDRTVNQWVQLEDYVSRETLKTLSIQKRSNLLRKALVSQHGGFWADSTLYCNTPLREWVNLKPASGVVLARAAKGKNRFIENFFIGSVPDGAFVKAWLKSYAAFLSAGIEPMSGGTLKRWRRRRPLLFRHHIATLVWTIRLVAKRTGYPYTISHFLASRLIITQPFQTVRYIRSQKVEAGEVLRYSTLPDGDNLFANKLDENTFVLWKLSWREFVTPEFFEGVYSAVSNHLTAQRRAAGENA